MEALKSVKEDITLDQARFMISQVDQNADGQLSREEFEEVMFREMIKSFSSAEDRLQ